MPLLPVPDDSQLQEPLQFSHDSHLIPLEELFLKGNCIPFVLLLVRHNDVVNEEEDNEKVICEETGGIWDLIEA